jgi:putative ABC transport system substrate-binding protein
LQELGYVEGQNLVIHDRIAHGQVELLPSLAAELVQLNVDVLVAGATPGARAALQATKTIPIIAPAMGDPVADGLVASLPSSAEHGSEIDMALSAAKALQAHVEALFITEPLSPAAVRARGIGDMEYGATATA